MSRALPVAMIGIGRRIEELMELGLEHTFADFRDHDGILATLASVTAAPGKSIHSTELDALRSTP